MKNDAAVRKSLKCLFCALRFVDLSRENEQKTPDLTNKKICDIITKVLQIITKTIKEFAYDYT